MKILAIDDQQNNLTMLKAVLADCLPAARLLTALSGAQGLELAWAEDPDVILLDIVMPGIDGYAVCRQLKADERLQSIPVLFLTPLKTDRESRVKALDAGAEGFLSKPFEEVELIAQIQAMTKIKVAQRSTALLRDVLDMVPAYVCAKNSEGRFLVVNKKLADFYGLPVDTMTGMLHADLCEDKEELRAMLAADHQVIESGKSTVIPEETMMNPDNSIAILETYKQPFSVGQEPAVLIASADITERRRAEETLRKSESRQGKMVANIGDVIVIIDPDGVNRYKSPNIEKWFGWRPEEVVGCQTLDNVHPEDVPAAQAFLGSLLAVPGASATTECRYRCKSGEYKWIEFTGVNLVSDPDIQGILGNYHDITERRRAEDNLRKSESRLQKIFDILPIGLWFADKTGNLLEGNPAGVEIWGAEPQVDPSNYGIFKARRLPSGEEIAPDDWALVHTIREGTTILDELLEIDAFDGQTKIMLNSTAPLLDEDGAVEGVVIVNQDITKRQKAEESLIKITERLNLALTSAKAGVWDWNLKTNEMIWDDRMLELYGIPRGNFSGGAEAWEQGLHPDDSARVIEDFQFALRGERNFDTEFRVRRPDGTVIHVKANGLVEHDKDGKPVRMTGLNTDITDRRQQEEKVALLGRMLDDAPAAIMIHDMDGCFVFANVEAMSMHGYDSIEAFLQVNLHELDVPESEVLQAERFQKIADEHEVRFEVEHYRKDGSTFPLAILAKSIEWEGHPAVLSIATDISMHKEAEWEKENLRTQFIHAQKMESVGRLAGGVAHDFNNMLQVILGHAERALADLPPESPVRESLQEIQTCGQRSAALTRQLLAFARKQTIAPKVLDLNEAVESILKMLRRLIGEDVKLLWQPGAGPHTIMMDTGQIDQILANLCVNARDAIEETGKIIVETDKVRIDENYVSQHDAFVPGDYIRLGVSDTGCGMNAETLANAFEPFFTTKANKGGTGLGLATVYGIVKQNKGFIDLYSEVGQGTTIKIYLPCHAGTAEFPCTEPAVAVTGSETILLVEDEVVILQMTRRCLERLGYTVLAASTPDEALRLVRKHDGKIALVLTDVVMPEMNGRDLSRSLESLHPGIKTLFMSGYTADVIALQGVLEEGVNFLQKPFSMADLSVKIREVLGDSVLNKHPNDDRSVRA